MTRSSAELRQAIRARFLGRIEMFTTSDETVKNLLSVASLVLEVNEIGSEAPTDEIEETIRSMLPPASVIYTDEYFKQPVFAVRTLMDVANLYECLPLSDDLQSAVDQQSRADSVLMAHAWLASVLVPTLGMLKSVVARYKSSINLSPVQLSLQTPSPTPGSFRECRTPARNTPWYPHYIRSAGRRCRRCPSAARSRRS